MNPHEERARRRKAWAIADYIWDRTKPADRISDLTVAIVRRQPQDIRDTVASHAGQRPPSDETWALVAEILAERVRIAQDGFREGLRRAG